MLQHCVHLFHLFDLLFLYNVTSESCYIFSRDLIWYSVCLLTDLNLVCLLYLAKNSKLNVRVSIYLNEKNKH